MRTTRRTALATTLAAASLAILLSACGGPSAPQPGAAGASDASAGGGSSTIPDTSALLSAVSEDATLAAMVPEAIASTKELKVGSNVQSAPNNFFAADGSTVIGSDHDIITAIGTKLGLAATYSNLDFGALITSLQSGRVDTTIAAMNDTATRQQSIDFVDYLTSGITLMVQKGNPAGITGPDTLCGKNIAVVTGTSQQTFAEDTSTKCVADGKTALNISVTDSDSQNQTQLRTGRIDAIVNDLPSAVYISKTTQDGNAFEVVPGDVIDGAPYGIGVNKDNPGLRDAIAKALDQLIEDGTYGKILDAWGISSGKVTSAVVNGGK
ncbi:ABC transporter substrate-binding protein [Subtercola boreus]|uniref:ABC transporter substrate-binding protein n=1 Tax=Subtercola boreus TaxID=120213 RepID=A0A3E0W675_9MICO|nr:ABC transporter substrate-binding protein [Subtercola boreus]RFA17033.1 ABC transporter substrate-binding protein [Subtercola boreus]